MTYSITLTAPEVKDLLTTRKPNGTKEWLFDYIVMSHHIIGEFDYEWTVENIEVVDVQPGLLKLSFDLREVDYDDDLRDLNWADDDDDC